MEKHTAKILRWVLRESLSKGKHESAEKLQGFDGVLIFNHDTLHGRASSFGFALFFQKFRSWVMKTQLNHLID